MKIQIEILVIFVVFLFGCENLYIFPNTKVKGSVYDSTTFEKIPYAEVSLYRNVHCRIADIEFCDSWERLRTELSDEKGNYIIKFDDEGKEYRISANKEGYYKTGYWYKVSRDRENVDCYLFPKGYITIHVKNILPFNEQDTINLEIQNIGNLEVIKTNYNLIGDQVDTLIYDTLYANFYHPLFWKVTKNNITHEFIDSIICETHVNVDFDIFY
ncbi:MAG: hypothetical protein JXB17_08335 [Bacteroidales bacterium]|nr:hypothetical protein [Bacteroidales bacterium]